MKRNTKGGGMPLWPLLLSVSYIPSPVHASSDDKSTSISVNTANVTVCPVPTFAVDSLSPFVCPVPTAFKYTLLDSDIAAGGSRLFCGSATVRHTASSSACSDSSATATHVDDPAGAASKAQVEEVIDISDQDLLNLLAAFESVQSAKGNGTLKLNPTEEDTGCHSQRQKIAAFGIGPVRGYSVDCAVNRQVVKEDCRPNADPLEALATSMIAKAESYQRAANKANLATAKAEAEGKAHREATSGIKAIEEKMKETHQIQLEELEVSRKQQAKSAKLHTQNVENEAILERERAEVKAMREELEERLSWFTVEKWFEAGLEALRQVINSLSEPFETLAVLRWRMTRSLGSYWMSVPQGLETGLEPLYQSIKRYLAGFKNLALPSSATFRFPTVDWSSALTRFNSAQEELDVVVLLSGLFAILYFAWICRMVCCSARVRRHRRHQGRGDGGVALASPVDVAELPQPATTVAGTSVTCTAVIVRPRSDAAPVVECRELVLASAGSKSPQPSTTAGEGNVTCTTLIVRPRTCRHLVLVSAVAKLPQPPSTAAETNVTCTTVIIRPQTCRQLVLASAVVKWPQPSNAAAETNVKCTTLIIRPRTCRQLVLASTVAKLPQPSTVAAQMNVTCTTVILCPRSITLPFVGPRHQLLASASVTAAQAEASDVAASVPRAGSETPAPVANLPRCSTTAAKTNVTCTAVILRPRSSAAPFDVSAHSVEASTSAPSTTEKAVSGRATVFQSDAEVVSISGDSASHARHTQLPQPVEMTVSSLISTTLSAALEKPVETNTNVLDVSQVVKPDTEVASQVSVLIACLPTTTSIALPLKQMVSAEASIDYSAVVGPQSRSDSRGETVIVLDAHIDVPNVDVLPAEANVCTPSATSISTPEDVPVVDTTCSDVIAESNEVNEIDTVQSSGTSSPLRDTASTSSTSTALEAAAPATQVTEPALPSLDASGTLDQPGRCDVGAAGSIDQHDAAIEAQQTVTSAIESTGNIAQPLASDPVTTAQDEAPGIAAAIPRAEPATQEQVIKSTQHPTTAVNTAVKRTSVAKSPRNASPPSRSGTRLVASALASLKTNRKVAESASVVGETATVDSLSAMHARDTQLPQLAGVNAPSPASATSDAVLEAFKTNARAKSRRRVVQRDNKVASPNASANSNASSAAPSALPPKAIVSAKKHADPDQPQKALRSSASETSTTAAATSALPRSSNSNRQMNGTTHKSSAVLERVVKTDAKDKRGRRVVKRDTKVASPDATPTSNAPSAAPSALPPKATVSAKKHADIDQLQKALRSMASETSARAAATSAPPRSSNSIRQMNDTTHNSSNLSVLATYASVASTSTSAQASRATNPVESVAPVTKNQAGRLVGALLSKPGDQQAKGKGVDIPDPAPPVAQDPLVVPASMNTAARKVVRVETKAKSTEAVVRDSQAVPKAELEVQKEGHVYGKDPYAIQTSQVAAEREDAAPAMKRGCRAGKQVQKARRNQAQRELEARNNVDGAIDT